MDEQEFVMEQQEFEAQQAEPVYEAPTYVEPQQAYQPAPQPTYSYVPTTAQENECDDEEGLDAKSVLLGAGITAVIGGAAIGIKKGIDHFKKKKAEKEEFKKWQEERKAAEEQVAKAKAEGKVVDVPAEAVTEVKEEAEEAKAEPETQPEQKPEEKKTKK